ncbi:MAG: ABC transporter permease [Gemmatimonadota bacterium]|nr:MAG: ABC transporter permease [Gemmatimonadota bacterium]
MLSRLFSDPLQLGIAQAAVTILLALAVVYVARRREVHLERETLISLLRGFVQVVAVGSILVLLFRGPSWSSVFVLLLMMLAAAATSARRARDIPGAFAVSFYGIVVGSGVVIALMTALGAIDPRMESLIPVGSMVIASGMNSNALALERFRSELTANVGYVEAGLALGATPNRVVVPYVQAAVRAAMIPRIDTLRALGIVWIPGLMAGMILAGSDPVYAAIYQFVVVGMIYAAAGLTSLVATLLIRSRAFSPAEQLVLGSQR